VWDGIAAEHPPYVWVSELVEECLRVKHSEERSLNEEFVDRLVRLGLHRR
jgi:hypothetical protein